MILVRYSRVLAGGILSRGDFSVKIFLSLLQGLREILFCAIGAGLRYGRIELHIAFYGIRRDDLRKFSDITDHFAARSIHIKRFTV